MSSTAKKKKVPSPKFSCKRNRFLSSMATVTLPTIGTYRTPGTFHRQTRNKWGFGGEGDSDGEGKQTGSVYKKKKTIKKTKKVLQFSAESSFLHLVFLNQLLSKAKQQTQAGDCGRLEYLVAEKGKQNVRKSWGNIPSPQESNDSRLGRPEQGSKTCVLVGQMPSPQKNNDSPLRQTFTTSNQRPPLGQPITTSKQ